MTGPCIVVFENDPEEKLSPWIRQTCEQAKLVVIDNAKIQAEVVKNPKAKPVIDSGALFTAREKLAPFYQDALLSLAAKTPRMALMGVRWLEYLPKVNGFIFDLGPVEAARASDVKGSKKLPPEKVSLMYDAAILMVRNIARQKVSPEKILELKAGSTEADKKSLASAFVQKVAG